MKKFVFRLETLLQHRHNIEERERIKFSCIRGELMAALEHMKHLRAKQAQTLSELASKKSGKCDSQEIAWFYSFLDRLSWEMERCSERIGKLEQHLEAQKQIMIEASRNKKMVQNLRNKKEKEFLVSLERIEQKSIDEIVVTRYARKQ
jgi:flagellar FliJ protein